MVPCPKCRKVAGIVIDSRWRSESRSVYRRRRCRACGHPWSTFEYMEERGVNVIKIRKDVDAMESELADSVHGFKKRLLDMIQPKDK